MKPGPNATIAFVYEPQPASESHPASDFPVGRGVRRWPKPAAGFSRTRISTSAKMNPRSLRCAACATASRPKTPTPILTWTVVPRRRADRFIWIALIAARHAVAAIAFGLWRDAREKQAEMQYRTSCGGGTPSGRVPTQNKLE